MLLKNLYRQVPTKLLMKIGFFLATFLLAGLAFAEEGGLGGIAFSITKSFRSFIMFMLALAYLAGTGFGIASLFKFKQHKDNPQQVTLGAPITLLVIAIALIFFAFIVKPLGETLGAKPEHAGGPTGSSISTIPGGSNDTGVKPTFP